MLPGLPTPHREGLRHTIRRLQVLLLQSGVGTPHERGPRQAGQARATLHRPPALSRRQKDAGGKTAPCVVTAMNSSICCVQADATVPPGEGSKGRRAHRQQHRRLGPRISTGSRRPAQKREAFDRMEFSPCGRSSVILTNLEQAAFPLLRFFARMIEKNMLRFEHQQDFVRESMSPNGFHFVVPSVGSCGRRLAEGCAGYEVPRGHGRPWHAVRFGFEFDPSQLLRAAGVEWAKHNANSDELRCC